MSLPHSSDRPQRAARRTQCAQLTGAGRSAVAVIGLRGSVATSIIDRFFVAASPHPLRSGQIRYGSWLDGGDGPGEAVVIIPIDTDHYEIHCHGGPAAIERIIGHLRESQVQQVDTFAWHPDTYLLISEARQVLARCLTERTAAIALAQVHGATADWAQHWINVLNGPASTVGSLRRQASQILSLAHITTRLTEPFRVVLIGPPNVGKSSLINAIVGYDRSITDAQAGTTRDVIEADTVIDGLPIRLSDTAGIRASSESIEQEGIIRAKNVAKAADLVLDVTAAQPTAPAVCIDLETVIRSTTARLQVINKIDMLSPSGSIPAGALPTNALTGEGVPELIESIGRQFAESLPTPSDPIIVSPRQAVAIRRLAHVATAEQAIRELHNLLHGSGDTDCP